MDTKLTPLEITCLDYADNDYGEKGYSDLKCPRCGNEIVVQYSKNSYTVRCKTDDCIRMDVRGI